MINISSQLAAIISGKEKIPIARVEVYDTNFTVPSKGFFVRYFSGVNPNASGTIRRTQFEPIIFKDWSNGLPVELSNYVGANVTSSGINVTDPYSIVYSGWYYAAQTGNYTFSTRSNAGTQIYVNSVPVLSGYELIAPNVSGYSTGIWPNKGYNWAGSRTLNPGWYEIKVDMFWNTAQTSGNGYPFLTAFHQYNSERPKVLSAGSVNYISGFLQPINVSNVIYVTEDVREDYIGAYSFEVPFDKNGTYSWNNGVQKFGPLKPNVLCSLYMGYATESGYNQTSGYTTNLGACSDFVQKFTGSIDSIAASASKDSRTLVVKCRDFGKKILNGLNENYPNRASYTPSVIANVDPRGFQNVQALMPNAYDNWIVYDVIEDLCLHGGIDPNYLNRGSWDTANYYKLESNLNWPFTSTYNLNGLETKNGDPFIFKLEYGLTLLDCINRFKGLLGLNFYFQENGNVLVKEPRHTQRVEVYESGTYGLGAISYSGTWNYYADINTSNRVFIAPLRTGSISNIGSYTSGILNFRFSGVGFSTYQTNHAFGSGYFVDIRKQSNNNIVFSGFYSDFSSTTRYGQLQEFTRDLPIDQYTAMIRPSGQFRLEGFEYYTSNIYKPLYSLSDNIDIGSVDFDANDESVRNEVICVGQQIGDKSYLYSKAIDLDSIANPDAFNYIGDKRTVTIVEPTIQSQRRLDWLAQTILQKYRRRQRNISVQVQGLPHLQVNDPVGINFEQLNLNSDSMATSGYNINNEQVYYVRGINSNLSQSKYTTNLTLTSLKPIESYRIPPAITTEVLSAIYAQNNNTIFANFRQETLNTPVLTGYGYNTYSEQAAFVSFDLFIDVDRLWVLIGDKTDGGELFKNIDIESKNPLITYTTIIDPETKEAQPAGGVWLHNGGGERWGRIVVPTAQNSFNGGQWIGQNSETHGRVDGVYPIAVWSQFRTIDQNVWSQGIWVPQSGTINSGNRALAWSPQGGQNKYFSFTNPSNASDSIAFSAFTLSDINKAYLPGFAVKNPPLELDLFMGPVASGLQFVSKNILVDQSSQFQYLGNKHNHWNDLRGLNAEAAAATNNYPQDRRIMPYIDDIGWVTIPFNNMSVSADNGPAIVGENILYKAEHLSNLDTTRALWGMFLFIPRLGDLAPRISLNGPEAKRILGFYPQGFNLITNAQMSGLPPSVTTPTGNGFIGSAAVTNQRVIGGNSTVYHETVNHVLNPITIRCNAPITLYYECRDWGLDYTRNDSTFASDHTSQERAVSSINFNDPFKKIEMYLVCGVEKWNPPDGGANMGTILDNYNKYKDRYYKYTDESNVIIPNLADKLPMRLDFQWRPARNWIRLHRFTITNSVTGERYSFTMRGQVFLGGPRNTATPYINSVATTPIGILRKL